jgi:CheY-like chemotaxis protein
MPYNVRADLYLCEDNLLLAGELVAAGLYREVATGHEICLETESCLPATHNGRVAEYTHVHHTWGQIQASLQTARRSLGAVSRPLQAACDDTGAKIRVLLATGRSFWGDGARQKVKNSEFEIIEKAPSCLEELEASLHARPDIVVLDTCITGGDGLEQLGALKQAHPWMALVLRTPSGDPGLAVRAIDKGAAGYLLKGVTDEDLLCALRAVASGAIVIYL